MGFDNEKKQALAKSDKSIKQSIDRGIREVVDFINSLSNYYTTSSCSGRIVLLEKSERGKKQESRWLFVSHEKARAEDIARQLRQKAKKEVWFMQEAAILHACCRSVDDAQKLLSIARDAGFKRSGMISISNRIMVEILSTERIAAIVAKAGKMLVDDNYISIITGIANRNMANNSKRINAFFKNIKGLR